MPLSGRYKLRIQRPKEYPFIATVDDENNWTIDRTSISEHAVPYPRSGWPEEERERWIKEWVDHELYMLRSDAKRARWKVDSLGPVPLDTGRYAAAIRYLYPESEILERPEIPEYPEFYENGLPVVY